MASKNVMIGTGAALAGLGGLATAALTVDTPTASPSAKPAAETVTTQTVVIRKVEHRTKRLKAHHRRASHAATTTVSSPAPAAAPAPVVQPAPVRVAAAPAPVTNTAPIRTRTSGSSGGSGDDGAEHESDHHSGSDDGAEHADD